METQRFTIEPRPVYLTFDDGPLEPYTSEILSLLAQHNAKATFFVCGQSALRFPETVKKIFDSGHALGNHSFSHPWVRSYLGLLQKEFIKTDQILHSLTGQRPTLLRAPWGIHWPWVKKFAQNQGYRLVRWQLSAFDWWQPSAKFMAEYLLRKIKPKQIILLHDGDQGKPQGRRHNTVEALKLLLPRLAEKNLAPEKLI